MRKTLLFFVALLLGCTLVEGAPNTYFTYHVNVSGTSGQPLANIPFRLKGTYRVKPRNEPLTFWRYGTAYATGRTDADGFVRVQAYVDPGSYLFEAVSMSVQSTSQDHVTVRATGNRSTRQTDFAEFVLAPKPFVHPENACVSDVVHSFDRIPTKVRSSPHFGSTKKYLGANNYGSIPWPRYTSNKANRFGLGEHFQAIQRIGRYIVVSGGIKNGNPRRSQLVVIQMGSQSETAPWALPRYHNQYNYKNPHPADRIVKVVNMDERLWHAGGIQFVGHVLAVPIFGNEGDSEVRFYDFETPKNPKLIPEITIKRPSAKSNAVAVSRLVDGHYVALVWNDTWLDFHVSRTTDIRDGFRPNALSIHRDSIPGGFQDEGCGITGCGAYQNLNLVRQCDGKLFLVGMRNTQKGSPTVTGKDYATLYRLDWTTSGYQRPPRVTKLRARQYYCYNQQCNFGAGAGLYVADRDHLWLYGASHWLHNGNRRYNFNEYSYR